MFADEMNPRVCEAGETIFQPYDMGAEMYVVLEGQVELTIDSQTLEMLGPENVWRDGLIDQAPRTATAIAKTAASSPSSGEALPLHGADHAAVRAPDHEGHADRLRK